MRERGRLIFILDGDRSEDTEGFIRDDYDEWMLCVEGEYIVTIDGVEHTLCAGDELFIPKGSVQGGRVKKGTRSIHAFGGQRIKG